MDLPIIAVYGGDVIQTAVKHDEASGEYVVEHWKRSTIATHRYIHLFGTDVRTTNKQQALDTALNAAR